MIEKGLGGASTPLRRMDSNVVGELNVITEEANSHRAATEESIAAEEEKRETVKQQLRDFRNSLQLQLNKVNKENRDLLNRFNTFVNPNPLLQGDEKEEEENTKEKSTPTKVNNKYTHKNKNKTLITPSFPPN